VAQKNSVMLMWWIVVLTTLIPLLNYLRGKAEGGLLDRAGTRLGSFFSLLAKRFDQRTLVGLMK